MTVSTALKELEKRLSEATYPYEAELGLTGWHGITWTRVRVIGHSKKKLRIATIGDEPVKLAGRFRWLHPGKTATVPPHAVRALPSPSALPSSGL